MASSPPFFEALVSKPVAAPLPPMPALPITSARTILNMKTLPVAAGDIFICSYPKSGTTWTQNIVYQLVTRGAPLAHISEYVPFFESDRTWADDDARGGGGGGPTVAEPYRSNFEAVGRRMFNTHCRWEMMPRGDGAKYVYLVRDGRDALVSFYHHLTHQAREPRARARSRLSRARFRPPRPSRSLSVPLPSPPIPPARLSPTRGVRPQLVEDGGFEGTFDAFARAWLDGEIAFGAFSGGPPPSFNTLTTSRASRGLADDAERAPLPPPPFLPPGTWPDHLASWLGAPGGGLGDGARHDASVLFLRYEDMKADLGRAARAIAAHCELGLSPAEVDALVPKMDFA